MMVLQLFNREERAYQRFSQVNEVHMEAFKDAVGAGKKGESLLFLVRRGDSTVFLALKR